jgi:hypothetical protein
MQERPAPEPIMITIPEELDGLFVHSLNPGAVIDLETRNRHYRIEYLNGDEVCISGCPSLLEDSIKVQLQGSTPGRGELKPGFIGRGMRLVFSRPEDGLSVTTSEIVSIRLNVPSYAH